MGFTRLIAFYIKKTTNMERLFKKLKDINIKCSAVEHSEDFSRICMDVHLSKVKAVNSIFEDLKYDN